jgi:two-component system sensor histidine kinase KdpD
MDTMRETKSRQDLFISSLNHDIRTPLAGAIGALELLASPQKDLTLSEESMFLACAKASCEEIARLTENIKDAIDPRDDVPAPRIEVFRLDVVVGELLRYIYTFEHPLEGIDLQAGLQVAADPLQVQRVLRNLIHNACKYSPRRSPIAVSIATCAWMDGFACISVRDKGQGIPLDQMDQLFQKFSRLGEKRVDGTGLGLYNCRRMIEGMGGQIWVESSGVDGSGSLFCFTLPLAKKQPRLSVITAPYPVIDIR